ncbi:hypothetical protein IW261DRAFT_1307215, partial [Armillaria novae-zelandiae]
MIIWLVSSLSPQQVRDRLVAEDSIFHAKLVDYLKSVHKGDYFNGTQEEVVFNMRHVESLKPAHVDHTEVLPEAPPPHCDMGNGCNGCSEEGTTSSWWNGYRRIVDMLVNKCNVHKCKSNACEDSMLKHNTNAKGCLDNRWKCCKARFPRKLYKEMSVDKDTGHINLIKKEAWINMFVPLITYIFRCNMVMRLAVGTYVTSLCSGTAIKAVLIYVMDYITKPGLKTHVVFNCIHAIFQ